ncbi:unnamed protein product [Oncorhynchus mykiss]|uniref:BTB domain-containing protein n=1 Tax=Oncorhynchus mykiss TaxID=8022 RepID=A0A060Y9U9_ONCMY|nr:unnamed protein product [Oncorhynchus mykiss]
MPATSKNYAITKRLSAIFSRCYGSAPTPSVPPMDLALSTQLDAHFLNNPEMSDVMLFVEGRPSYAHRVLLMSASKSLFCLCPVWVSAELMWVEHRHHPHL